MADPPKLDEFEMDLFKKGFHPVIEAILNEETEHSNPHKVFPNIKSIYNDLRALGFQEEIIIRIRYADNQYKSTVYVKK